MKKCNFWNKKQSIIRSDLLVNPTIKEIINNVKNKNILDLGCGDGNLTEYFASKGAIITGVDKDCEKIERAKNGLAKYQCVDINNAKFKRNTFDIIYSSMVFLFLNEKELEKILYKINIWLKKDGVFVFSDIHPSMEIQKHAPKLAKYITPESFNYFKTQKTTVSLLNLHNDQTTFEYYHRALSKYSEILSKSGFTITDLFEPSPSKEQQIKFNNILEIETKNPSYLIYKLRKQLL